MSPFYCLCLSRGREKAGSSEEIARLSNEDRKLVDKAERYYEEVLLGRR